MKLLDNINSPKDLKQLRLDQLPQLCTEVREFIINHLSNNPGHLGSSLGVVELTVALHYVYDTPIDNLIWDVGHQAYAHKILTGRRDLFFSNRMKNGISGFPKRSESEYDSFGGGHSSVSISAALGMSVASSLLDENKKNIAVIGDGALTGGLAFEGLNNAGFLNEDVLVVLNDNDMSIDPNVGALNRYLIKITTSSQYNRFKDRIIDLLEPLPFLSKTISKLFTGARSSLLKQSNLFTSLDFRYFGVTDGHNVIELVNLLNRIKKIKGAKLLHILTVKGKGYAPAETNQTEWHAPGKYDVDSGEIIRKKSKNMPFNVVFGNTILELARRNKRIIGITPAMPTGSSLSIMQAEIPERVFDVGIAEGHAVTFSGAAAVAGLIPFCNIYSSFMQRAYDNVIHDIVLQGADVVLCIDRGGLVGEDGATHHGVLDIAYFRPIPNIIIAAPSDEHELRNLMYTASLGGNGAFVIRYPRGEGSLGENWKNELKVLPIGVSNRLRNGDDIAILSLGTTTVDAAKAIEEVMIEEKIDCEHIDLRFAKPLDAKMLLEVGEKHKTIITIEDGVVSGGVGSAILDFYNENSMPLKIIKLGVSDEFVQHGTIAELKKECKYDKDSIKQKIIENCKK